MFFAAGTIAAFRLNILGVLILSIVGFGSAFALALAFSFSFLSSFVAAIIGAVSIQFGFIVGVITQAIFNWRGAEIDPHSATGKTDVRAGFF